MRSYRDYGNDKSLGSKSFLNSIIIIVAVFVSIVGLLPILRGLSFTAKLCALPNFTIGNKEFYPYDLTSIHELSRAIHLTV